MLGRKDRRRNVFDEESFARMIPPDHPLVVIKPPVDFGFVEETVRPLYTVETGRPRYPPETLFRILFREIFAPLSEVQVVDALRDNLLYRDFCDLGCDDPVPDDTTLVVFRRRLGEAAFRPRFARRVDAARQQGLIQEEWMIVDGTQGKSHAAERGPIELLREGRRRVVKEIARTDTEQAQALEPLAEAVDDRLAKNQEELLAKEVERTEAFLTQAAAVETKTAPVLQEMASGQGPQRCVDPEARWGVQKTGQPFFGYKPVLVCDPQGFVTALTLPATRPNPPPWMRCWTTLPPADCSRPSSRPTRRMMAKTSAPASRSGGAAPTSRPAGRRTGSPQDSPTIRRKTSSPARRGSTRTARRPTRAAGSSTPSWPGTADAVRCAPAA